MALENEDPASACYVASGCRLIGRSLLKKGRDEGRKERPYKLLSFCCQLTLTPPLTSSLYMCGQKKG